MTNEKQITAVDMYCGAGGASEGLKGAARLLGRNVELTAINHWDTAIATHSKNFPGAKHLLTEVEKVKAIDAVPGGHLDVLLAGPSCVHFSRSRGGRPVTNQQRSGAWEIIYWARDLDIDNILVENVPEFLTWGPVDEKTGRPAKDERRGSYFRQWVRMLRSLGYNVEWRVLNAAHFGDATTRKRLFIQAKRPGKQLSWPVATHHAPSDRKGFKGSQPWKTAREIIDWSLQSQSIFGRKRPLVINTRKRIFAGMVKFNGLDMNGIDVASISMLRPFIVVLKGTSRRAINNSARDVDSPLSTIHGDGHFALCEPYLYYGYSGKDAASLDAPLPTVTAKWNHLGVCQPYMIPVTHNGGPDRCYDIESPVPTITTAKRGEIALIEPIIVVLRNNADATGIDEPIRTLTCGNNMSLIQPYLVNVGGPLGRSREPRSIDDPLATVLGENHTGLLQPYLVRYNGHPDRENRTESVDAPLSTLDTSNRLGLATPQLTVCAEPFLISYYGTGEGIHSIDDPLDTVTTRDRFALVQAQLGDLVEPGDQLALLDIKFRMLQPHELAAAHSFPKSYFFSGGREDKVRQVGNSWPVAMSQALCLAMLTPQGRPSMSVIGTGAELAQREGTE